MFSIHTDDECFYVGIERGNDNSKKSLKSHIAPYQCCPTTKERPSARLSVLSDTNLGNSKEQNNDITFKFEKPADQKSAGKPKRSKSKTVPKPAAQEDRKAKKEDKKESAAPAAEKKKRDRDVKEKEKEPKDSKDKDIDKKEKKGKEKKEKGKHAKDGDGDGFFQLGNWW